MPELQMRARGDSQWVTPSFPVEQQLIINYWKEVMPPDMIRWWTICWKNGTVIYYRWASGRKPPMVPEDVGPQEL